ncbi:MAG: flagellar hook-basal body complex protein FliE [Pseudomonadota bacterium]
MSINALSAANAYRSQLKLQNDIVDSAAQDETNKSSFSNMLKDGLQNAIDTQYKTEGVKMEALTGKVDLSDLVTAITNAELSLNTVIAVRDKVIGAYQDIIRMPM